jgi:hypothetical protein
MKETHERNIRLPFQHLKLILQPAAIVFARTLKIVMHFLDIDHEIRYMRALEGQCFVFFSKAALYTL